MKVLAKNRRASYEYTITDHLIAGIELQGHEVKSLKAGSSSLKGSFVALRDNEAFLMGAHVTPYANAASKSAIDPTRARKLLLHRRQLSNLVERKQAGESIVPTAVLLDHNLIKIELGIGRGKKRYDKRESLKQRDIERELARRVRS